ncbi:hypothetical protein G6F57_016191 [Rhizopus arrhizus]|nr:hypothetical protein G6F57_016191 [Rhizopus arrhizus]
MRADSGEASSSTTAMGALCRVSGIAVAAAPQLLDAQTEDIGQVSHSCLLFLQQEHRGAQDDRDGGQQRPERPLQRREIQRLAEHAAADRQHVRGGVDLPDQPSAAFQRRHRIKQAGELHGGHQRADHGEEQRRDLAARERRGQQTDGGGHHVVDQRGRQQGCEAAGDGDAEQRDRQQGHQQEIQHRQRHVGRLLAQRQHAYRMHVQQVRTRLGQHAHAQPGRYQRRQRRQRLHLDAAARMGRMLRDIARGKPAADGGLVETDPFVLLEQVGDAPVSRPGGWSPRFRAA